MVTVLPMSPLTPAHSSRQQQHGQTTAEALEHINLGPALYLWLAVNLQLSAELSHLYKAKTECSCHKKTRNYFIKTE